ncbi:class I SAM-dependent methyltransferase [Thermoflavifilum thermophilum]|uniref:Methyltransferase domain-containing protein n=1 Tax=Thermoflavifilum thermophilum TaxID=1393122 RepID=A0A1I7N9X5_9BACT|nr:class I SAM-dependent methyltransferase [Thermoflavifilum thermophilum]SFV31383.1 Methyltransferase domain-containing protein [Thermoflavifilum thermophilum]
MAFTTRVKETLNACLRKFNLKIDTLTAERIENERISCLSRKGIFDEPVYDLSPLLSEYDPYVLLDTLKYYQNRFSSFEDEGMNEVGYSFKNGYYTTPDAEVLYSMVRSNKPGLVIEIGSGNSTKIIRQAIVDEKISCKIISIDPHPRSDIDNLSDHIYRKRIEEVYLENHLIFDELKSNDILFIDSSHHIKVANDVVFLYNLIIPHLSPGVVIHMHDIYLPYEYPLYLVKKGWRFVEQYLLHALLTQNMNFRILWAGYYTYRTLGDFDRFFPSNKEHLPALSFWMRKIT